MEEIQNTKFGLSIIKNISEYMNIHHVKLFEIYKNPEKYDLITLHHKPFQVNVISSIVDYIYKLFYKTTEKLDIPEDVRNLIEDFIKFLKTHQGRPSEDFIVISNLHQTYFFFTFEGIGRLNIYFNDEETIFEFLKWKDSGYTFNEVQFLMNEVFKRLDLIHSKLKFKGILVLKSLSPGQTLNSIDITYQYVKKENLIKGIYPEFFLIDPEKFIQNYFTSSESIIIFSGQPGTGKSKFISYIMAFLEQVYVAVGFERVDKFVSLVKYILKELNDYEMEYEWMNLNFKPEKTSIESKKVFIFDDFDILKKREKDNDDQSLLISNLLKLSDGIYAENPKIIISTNKPIDYIDDALLRPGRTFDVIEFKLLPADYIIATFEEILNKEKYKNEITKLSIAFEKVKEMIDKGKREFSLAEIGDIIQNIKLDIKRDYLKDQSLSIIEKIRRGELTPKIGFKP